MGHEFNKTKKMECNYCTIFLNRNAYMSLAFLTNVLKYIKMSLCWKYNRHYCTFHFQSLKGQMWVEM